MRDLAKVIALTSPSPPSRMFSSPAVAQRYFFLSVPCFVPLETVPLSFSFCLRGVLDAGKRRENPTEMCASVLMLVKKAEVQMPKLDITRMNVVGSTIA